MTSRWLIDFNHVSPHAALGRETPAQVYRPVEHGPIALVDAHVSARLTHTAASQQRRDFLRRRPHRHRPGAGAQARRSSLRGGLRWRIYFFDVDLGTIEYRFTERRGVNGRCQQRQPRRPRRDCRCQPSGGGRRRCICQRVKEAKCVSDLLTCTRHRRRRKSSGK